MTIVLAGNELTFSQLYAVALHHEAVSLSPDAVVRMNASRAVVDQLVASGKTAYGINTGFGKLASVRISTEQVRQLQINLVRSHSCGVGAPFSEAAFALAWLKRSLPCSMPAFTLSFLRKAPLALPAISRLSRIWLTS
jgi:histidine ammonia-lyase